MTDTTILGRLKAAAAAGDSEALARLERLGYRLSEFAGVYTLTDLRERSKHLNYDGDGDTSVLDGRGCECF